MSSTGTHTLATPLATSALLVSLIGCAQRMPPARRAHPRGTLGPCAHRPTAGRRARWATATGGWPVPRVCWCTGPGPPGSRCCCSSGSSGRTTAVPGARPAVRCSRPNRPPTVPCARGAGGWGRRGPTPSWEAGEELGLRRTDVVLGAESVDDHGGWSYTTVLASPAGQLEPADLALNEESTGVGWFPLDRLPEVPLHPGLAASLPVLRSLLAG